MKLSHLLLTFFAFPAIAMAGITTSGSVLTESGAIYDGSDPWVVASGTLNVGTSTTAGHLEVSSGSSVTASGQVSVKSPITGGSTSSLLVDGIGSQLTTFGLGLDGGLLQFQNGASVSSFGLSSVSLDGRVAQTFIRGPSTLLESTYLNFYGNGTSQISVSNGARLVSRHVQGSNDGSSFSVNVGGGTNTSQWIQNGTVTMGTTGNDLIDIRGGGLVRMEGGSLVLGAGSSGTGTIRVDGTDGTATLQLLVPATVGTEGGGNLSVTNGGSVVVNGGYMTMDSSSLGGSGRISIGGGANTSAMTGASVWLISGSSSLVEVLENGMLDAYSMRVRNGAGVIVGGGSSPATLNSSVISVHEGGHLDVLQGGLVGGAIDVIDAGSRLRLDGGMIAGEGYLGYNGALPVHIMAGGGTISASAGGVGVLLGATTGSGVLIKEGLGTMTFDGLASHAATRVLAGSLALAAGSRTTGAVEVLAEARLTGRGSLEGLLTLSKGAWIAPGTSQNVLETTSPGILQTASAIWMSGGFYEWKINNALGNNGINWDLVQINGSLDLVGLSPSDPFVIAVRSLFESNGNAGLATNFDSQSSYRFTILTTTSGIVGFDASDFRLDLTGFANANFGDAYWQLEQWNNGLDLVYNFAPVPEPGSAIFIAVTALATLARRRRR